MVNFHTVVAVVALGLVNLGAVAQAQFGHCEFSSPTKDKTEVVVVSYVDPNGQSQSPEVNVPLKKGMTADEKAQAIADAMNAMGGLSAATLTGGGVLVAATGGGQLRKVSVSNNTGEKENTAKVTNSALSATVSFAGTATGLNSDGDAAEVMVGTRAGRVVVSSSSLGSIESLVSALVDELAAIGVIAQQTDAATLELALGAEDWLAYGCDDMGLVQTASVEVADVDGDAEQDG